MIMVKKGRSLNPNRMRHYLVKSTPDVQTHYFDPRDLEINDQIQEVIHKYAQAMYLKHGPMKDIQTWLGEDLNKGLYKLVLRLK